MVQYGVRNTLLMAKPLRRPTLSKTINKKIEEDKPTWK